MRRAATETSLHHPPTLRLLVLAGAVVAGLTWWGWRHQPPTRLVGSQRVAGGSIIPLALAPGQDRPRAWRAELRLGPVPPGGTWSLFEGAAPGDGYELHWLPRERCLALWRAQRPLLLGVAPLDQAPGQVVLTRRGARLDVVADGREVLLCLDPVGVPEPLDPPSSWAWGCRADPALNDATVTVQVLDGRHDWGADVPVRSGPDLDKALADRQRPDRPLLLVRQALGLVDAGRDPAAAGFALGQALVALDPHWVLRRTGAAPLRIPGDNRPDGAAEPPAPDPARDPGAEADHLRLWLGLGRVRLALATRQGRSGSDPQLAPPETVAAELAELAASGGDLPELPGLVLSLLPTLAAQATWAPDYPRPPAEVLAARVPWCRLLGETAADLEGRVPAALRPQLRLVAHGAGTALERLAGSPAAPPPAQGFAARPLPTPIDAPAWLTARWRALAGTDPGAGRLQALPTPAAGPLVQAIERLVAAAGIEPFEALRTRVEVVKACSRLRIELGGEREGEALRLLDAELEAAPARESALARAMAALHLPGGRRIERLQEARKELLAGPGGLAPAQTDPLAFALLTLIEAGNPGLVGAADQEARRDAAAWTRIEGDGPLRRLPLPRRLAAYAPLLDGRPRSIDHIWIGDLHPSQALVAAVAMQQVAWLAERSPSAGIAGDRDAGDGRPRTALPAPDWSLLRRLPCLTLPAELLIPADPPAGRGAAGSTGPGRAIPP